MGDIENSIIKKIIKAQKVVHNLQFKQLPFQLDDIVRFTIVGI